ncbi:recombination protein NinB [Yersinia enterocolitica]|nr:recombination protein NinB [Yersinia enterocolitica]
MEKIEFCFHETTRLSFWQLLKELVSTKKRYRVVITEWRDKRSISQNSLSHLWYSEISHYLKKNGNSFATPEWVKDSMKHMFLGCEEKEIIDLRTGEVTVISVLKKTSNLNTGDMHFYLNQIEAWAFGIGCHLTIPERCEYQKLKQQQVA